MKKIQAAAIQKAMGMRIFLSITKNLLKIYTCIHMLIRYRLAIKAVIALHTGATCHYAKASAPSASLSEPEPSPVKTSLTENILTPERPQSADAVLSMSTL
jgi:hypothetical protein